ncbi:MAG: hypothetical protein KatS3mg053_0709 [Candidatus Roseilinea sp.]|nr:MAG: hypothetical protein KatS3mg053_0709 [Candidatus Roseilinea sp.]
MSNVGQRQSLEQQRAAAAWRAVQDVPVSNGKEFKSVATGLPADIQSSGLGQTMAFLRAKGKEEHKAVFNAVTGWIKQRLNITDGDFMEWLMTKASTEQYRYATSEAIALAIWIKRFAEARFKE